MINNCLFYKKQVIPCSKFKQPMFCRIFYEAFIVLRFYLRSLIKHRCILILYMTTNKIVHMRISCTFFQKLQETMRSINGIIAEHMTTEAQLHTNWQKIQASLCSVIYFSPFREFFVLMNKSLNYTYF